jgi:uncharacterized protein GlcG (DUF336 family)
MTAAGTFVESERISYGKAGGVTFKKVGHGVLGASGVGGLRRAPDGACAAIPEVGRPRRGLAHR